MDRLTRCDIADSRARMIARIFSRSALHEHADPAQRVQGVAALPPDSGELARLLAADPAPEVRIAAAQRCSELPALAAALDDGIRSGRACGAGRRRSAACLPKPRTRRPPPHSSRRRPAPMRSAPTSRAARADADRRRTALAHIRDEALLVDARAGRRARRNAPGGGRARATPRGPAQARRRGEEQGSRRRAARPAAHRCDRRARGHAEGGRRASGAARGARRRSRGRSSARSSTSTGAGRRSTHATTSLAARAGTPPARSVQARFDREHDEQRARAQFERRLREWIDALQPPADAEAFELKRGELAALRDIAQEPQRRGGARDAGRGRSSGSPAGSRIATRSPAPRRSSSKRSSSRPARRSTTRICRSAGARSIARCAAPR